MRESDACRGWLFDARWSGPHGIGRFAAEIARRLPGYVPLRGPLRPSSPLDPWWLSAHLLLHPSHLFFSPGYNCPAAGPTPYVFTLHDLIHIDAPGPTPAAKRAYFAMVLRPGIRRAAAVLTVSEYSRRRIVEWSGCADGNVTNVSNGVSTCFCAEGARAEIGLPYFLHVGRHAPHKNLARLFRAFALSGLWRSACLVLVGGRDPAVYRLAAAAGVSDSVVLLGPLPDHLLASYYRGAMAVVVPSLLEGFGLTVVEAMACGTPVIAASTGALPETAAGAAVLVDPLDVDSIAQALGRLAGDDELRSVMRARGIRNADRFSWDETARRVSAVLDTVASRTRAL